MPCQGSTGHCIFQSPHKLQGHILVLPCPYRKSGSPADNSCSCCLHCRSQDLCLQPVSLNGDAQTVPAALQGEKVFSSLLLKRANQRSNGQVQKRVKIQRRQQFCIRRRWKPLGGDHMRNSSSGKVHICDAIFEISNGFCAQLCVSVSGALISFL